MLSRYKMYRGARPLDDPLPDGIRQDTRKHTRHCIAPDKEMVEQILDNPSDPKRWETFSKRYNALLVKRFKERRAEFDALAEQAQLTDLYFGCSCPTGNNPDPLHCHTVLALKFMQEKYPALTVVLPR